MGRVVGKVYPMEAAEPEAQPEQRVGMGPARKRPAASPVSRIGHVRLRHPCEKGGRKACRWKS